jgi:hypothetical protein
MRLLPALKQPYRSGVRLLLTPSPEPNKEHAPLPPTIKSRSRVGETSSSALVFHRHVIEVSAPRFPARQL